MLIQNVYMRIGSNNILNKIDLGSLNMNFPIFSPKMCSIDKKKKTFQPHELFYMCTPIHIVEQNRKF